MNPLLQYLTKTQKRKIHNISKLQSTQACSIMFILQLENQLGKNPSLSAGGKRTGMTAEEAED